MRRSLTNLAVVLFSVSCAGVVGCSPEPTTQKITAPRGKSERPPSVTPVTAAQHVPNPLDVPQCLRSTPKSLARAEVARRISLNAPNIVSLIETPFDNVERDTFSGPTDKFFKTKSGSATICELSDGAPEIAYARIHRQRINDQQCLARYFGNCARVGVPQKKGPITRCEWANILFPEGVQAAIQSLSEIYREIGGSTTRIRSVQKSCGLKASRL